MGILAPSTPKPTPPPTGKHRATAQTRPENRARNIPGVGTRKK